MVFGRGFESRLHLKTLCKDAPLDGRKTNENNKDSQMGQVTQTQKKVFGCTCFANAIRAINRKLQKIVICNDSEKKLQTILFTIKNGNNYCKLVKVQTVCILCNN